MAISIVCPSCKERGKVPDHAMGHRVRCPHCQHSFQVPRSEEMPEVEALQQEPSSTISTSSEPVEAKTQTRTLLPVFVIAAGLIVAATLFLLLPRRKAEPGTNPEAPSQGLTTPDMTPEVTEAEAPTVPPNSPVGHH